MFDVAKIVNLISICKKIRLLLAEKPANGAFLTFAKFSHLLAATNLLFSIDTRNILGLFFSRKDIFLDFAIFYKFFGAFFEIMLHYMRKKH
jgi:hypothetical protein